MHMHRSVTLVVVVCLVSATAIAPATAQSDDGGLLDTITGGELTLSERINAANDALAGLLSRAQYEASTVSDKDTQASSTLAEEITTEYNSHNATIETYVNARFAGTASDWDVIKVTVEQDNDTATRYLVATATDDGNFTDSRMVSETSRTVDQTVVLRDYAAANAATELDRFVTEYVEEDRDIDAALRRRLAQQYGGDVTLPSGVAA
jgi:hypothetical protein